jgi:Tfp pilus assembly protein FimT
MMLLLSPYVHRLPRKVSQFSERSVQRRRGFVGADETGLTLIEVLVAIGIMTILIATAAVGLGALAPKFNLDNGVRTAAMALHQARTQAITRGHTVEVTFDAAGFTITDATNGDEFIAEGEVPSGIVLSPSDIFSFTPLGMATAPQTVSISNGDHSRDVRVGLTGEVMIE